MEERSFGKKWANIGVFLIVHFSFLILVLNPLTKAVSADFIKDIRAEYDPLVADKYKYIALNLTWNANISEGSSDHLQLHVSRMSGDNDRDCEPYCFISYINKTQTSIVLPKEPPLTDHSDCKFNLGCTYNITMETDNGTSNYTIYKVPECVNNTCKCHSQSPRNVNFSAIGNLNRKEILIKWFVELSKNISLPPTKLKEITFEIQESDEKTKHSNKVEKTVSFDNVDPLKIIEHQTIIEINSLSRDYKYQIMAIIKDYNNCTKTFRPILVFENDEELTSTTSESVIYLLTTFIIIVSVIAVVTSFFYWKKINNLNTDRIGNGNDYIGLALTPHTIVMEDSLIYTDADILEAQKANKADSYEISANLITLECEVGQGAFGIVFKAVAHNLGKIQGNRYVAVKQLKKCSSREDVEEFLEEMTIMKSYGYHPNIVQLLGCCTLKEPISMIMEYVGNGNLLEYLHNLRKKYVANQSVFISISPSPKRNQPNGCIPSSNLKYPELKLSENSMSSEKSYVSENETNHSSQIRPSVTETMYTMVSQLSHGSTTCTEYFTEYSLDHNQLHEFAIEISMGMKHLEALQITHRDLAARNILIDERRHLKISDFGLSRNGVYVNTKSRRLPLRWLAIEAMRDHSFSSKSDVWAYGVVLWEIGTLGAFPYPNICNSQVRSFLESGQRLEQPKICTKQLYELMYRCWSEEPNERPTFNEILKELQRPDNTIYVDLQSIGSDYVFPPSKHEIKTTKDY